jgi:hypothetical protein
MGEQSPAPTPYWVMNFEGKLYVGDPGKENITGLILVQNVRNVKISYNDAEVDATLRRHEGNKAYVRGVRDFSATMDLANIKNDDGTRPADIQFFLNSFQSRRKMFSAFFLDEENGEGPCGDFICFFGDGGDGDEEADKWSMTLRPAAFGRKVEWYKTPTPEG